MGVVAIAATARVPLVTLGRACERSGECPAPLVCRNGRCREECVEHRDCPLDARCITGSDGLGVCTLLDDTCDATRAAGR